MLALPHGAPETGRNRLLPAGRCQRMAGQKRREVRRDADGPHARASPAVWNRERLVQVQVAHVGADRRRAGEPDLRVHVRAVHVDLAAVLVDDGADLADRFLVDAVRGRVRDHQRGEIARVLVGLLLEIRQVDVAARVAGRHDHLHPGHHRARRVGAVRRGGNQHDVAVALAAALMPGADDEQAGQLALRAGVRLQRDRREAGDLAQRGLERREHLGVAGRLLDRCEWVQAGELRPRHRDHLGRGIQLHRAGAERDHRRVEADVLPLEAADVAHHLRLGVMRG